MPLRKNLRVSLMTDFLKTVKVKINVCYSVVVESFPRPFQDLSNCLKFEIVRYIKIPTTEAIESNDLNIEN